MLLTKDEGFLATAPLHEPLVAGMKGAVEAWRKLVKETPEIGKSLTGRSRANFIYDLALSRLEPSLQATGYARYADSLQFRCFLIEPSALLRVKHVGSGAPRNYRTTQQKHLSRQEFTQDMLDLLDLPDAVTVLTCGYALEGTKLSRVEVRMDCAAGGSWSFPIFGEDISIERTALPGLEDDTKPAVVRSAKELREEATEVKA